MRTLSDSLFVEKGFSKETRVRIPKYIIKQYKICSDSDYYILQIKN